MCCCFYVACFCCFTKLNTKTLEIILIVFHSIAVFFLFCSFFAYNWKVFKKALAINIILFILMELISIACLVFSILLLVWRTKNLIKIKKRKQTAKTISMIGFIFAIILIAATIIEEYVFLYFSEFTNEDDMTFFFGILTLSILELTTFLEIGIWHIEKNRVEFSLDIPPPPNSNSYGATVRQTSSTARKTIYEPNKRKKNDIELKHIFNRQKFFVLNESEIEVISIEI